jgi:integrase
LPFVTQHQVVPQSALEALQEHRERQNRDKSLFGSDYEDHNLIFCRPDGACYHPDKVSVRVTELARRCGLPKGIGLHALRHTHASELLSKGTPIPVVSLGHANPDITLSLYAHAPEADELASAKVWEDAMADVIAEQRNVSDAERVSQSVTTARPKIKLIR